MWLVFIFLTQTALAQSIWMDKSVDKVIWLEVQKPDYTKEYLGEDFYDSRQTTLATSVLFLSGQWRVSKPFAFRAEIPFASWGYKDYSRVFFITTYDYPTGTLDTLHFSGFSETGFGNPLAAVQLGGGTFPLLGEIGVRFPLARTEPAARLAETKLGGSYSNQALTASRTIDYDRLEAFLEDFWSFTAAAEYQFSGPSGAILRLRAAPVWTVSLNERARYEMLNNPFDNEVYADYSFQVGYQSTRLLLLTGVTSRSLLTAGENDLGEKTISHWGFAASYSIGHFIPGFHFRLPLDEQLSRDLDFVFGFHVGYALPGFSKILQRKPKEPELDV